MYLIHYEKFVEQILPPHWRGQWQHHVIATLCAPLKDAFDTLYQMRVDLLEDVDDNLQLQAFENRLNQINNFSRREISIGEGSRNGAIKIIIPNQRANEEETVKERIKKHFKRVKIASTTIEIENET